MGLGYLELWQNALTKPVETLKTEKKNTDLMEGIKQVAIAFAIPGLLAGLVLVFIGSMLAFIPGAGFLAGLGIIAIIAAPIFSAVFGVIAMAIGQAVLYVVSTAMGGKGTYEQQFYLSAIWSAPLMLLSMILGVVPFLGALLSLLLSLYGLYLLWLTLKAVHGFDDTKAIIVIVVLVVAAFIVGMIFGGLAMLGLAAGMGR